MKNTPTLAIEPLPGGYCRMGVLGSMLLLYAALCSLLGKYGYVEAAAASGDKVLTITKDNLNEMLIKHGSMLSSSYPACGHCRKFQPEWDSIAKVLKGKITLGRVNGLQEKELVEIYRVKEFPTVKFFKSTSATPEDYKGPLTAESIVKFVYRKTDPILYLNTREEIDGFINSWDNAALAFFDDRPALQREWSSEWKAFKECSKKAELNHIGFGVATSLKTASEYGVQKRPSIVLFRKWDTNLLKTTSDSWKDLCQWLAASSSPVMEEYSREKYLQTSRSGTPIGMIYFDQNKPKKTEELITTIHRRVQKYKGRMKFYYFKNGQAQAEEMMKLGSLGTNFPTFIIHDPFRKKYYPFDDSIWAKKFDPHKMELWVDQFFHGKLTPRVKSEEILVAKVGRHDHPDPDVVTITGNSFNEIVMDTTKDVVVLFYAPWCEKCKAFAPIYQTFGEALCEVESIVVGKMDITKNDPPAGVIVGVGGYPEVLLFPANSKWNPIKFTGEKKASELLRFAHKHASIEFQLPPMPISEETLDSRQSSKIESHLKHTISSSKVKDEL